MLMPLGAVIRCCDTACCAQVLPFATYCAAVQRDVHTIMGMCEGAAADTSSGNVPVVAGLNSEVQQPEGPAVLPLKAPSSRVSAPAALEYSSPAVLGVPDTANGVQLQRVNLPPGLSQQLRGDPKAPIERAHDSLTHVDSRTLLLSE